MSIGRFTRTPFYDIHDRMPDKPDITDPKVREDTEDDLDEAAASEPPVSEGEEEDLEDAIAHEPPPPEEGEESPAEEAPQEKQEEFEEAVASAPPGDLDRTVIRDLDESQEKTPRAGDKFPYLVIAKGPRSGTRFPLSEDKNVIGRSPGCAVRLDDQSVSRQHAEITRVPGGWSVRDMGSKNGTIVNQNPVTEPVIIGHKDFIKVGIYLLRLITQEISRAEEMTLPAELIGLENTVMTEMPPPDGRTTSMEEAKGKEVVSAGEKPSEEAPPQGKRPKIPPRIRKLLAPIGVGLIIIVIAGYLANRFLASPAKPSKDKEAPVKSVAAEKPTAAPTKPGAPEAPGADLKPGAPAKPGAVPGKPPAPGAVVPAQPVVPLVKKIPVFLDFVSSPLPAKIGFQGKDVGKTPLRINVELEPNKTYEAEGVFEMPSVGEQYVQKLQFTVDPDKSVIPLLFRGPIGMIKINDLPRDAQFYLEGKFEYDKYSERSAKLGEIVLRKPIYLPFGKYTLELRRARQLGASQTYVQDIIYRREFTLAQDSPSFVFAVTDEDLKTFPASIRSEPPNADVYVDSKKVGKTPYEGLFPLGEHALTLRKEGYFEYNEELKVDMNTPFKTNIKLQTSVAGAHINNAAAAMNRAMYQEAVNELAEALNSNPAPSEVAKANFMLGLSYFGLNDVQRAMGYFELARQNEQQKYPATLGLVKCYAALNQKDKAIPLLVDVLLNNKDEDVKREANGIFQKISPFRSIIYVHSTPEGATVTVNDKQIGQKTPVILHDMGLGTYKLKVEKPGFIPTELRLNLSVNEFNPVVVKLKPIPK